MKSRVSKRAQQERDKTPATAGAHLEVAPPAVGRERRTTSLPRQGWIKRQEAQLSPQKGPSSRLRAGRCRRGVETCTLCPTPSGVRWGRPASIRSLALALTEAASEIPFVIAF